MAALPVICGFCGCGCRLYLDSSPEGDVIGVVPSDTSPVNAGRLCRRGWHLFQPLRSRERLHHPQRRDGSSWAPCSWPEASALLSDRLSSYSPQEVAFIGSPTSLNEEAYALVRYARGVLGTPHVDFPGRGNWARLYEPLAAALPSEALCASMEDLLAADLVLLMGLDEGHAYPQITFWLHQARSQGKPWVVISQHAGDLAQQATLHLCPHPHSESAWLVALTERLQAGSAGGHRRSRQVEEAGLAWEAIEPLMELVARAERLLVVCDTGSPQGLVGPEAIPAFLAWARGCWEVGKRCQVLLTAERCNTRGAWLMGLVPDRLPGGHHLTDPEARQRVQKAWQCSLPTGPGYDLPHSIRAAAQGELKALVVVGTGWEEMYPWPHEWREALRRLEFVAVVESFPDALREEADLLLPRPLPGETEGTYINLEGRVQRSERAVLSSEGWSEWQLWQAAAEQAGHAWGWDSAAAIRREMVTGGGLDPSFADLGPGEWAWGVLPSTPGRPLEARPVFHHPLIPSQEFPLHLLVWSHPSDWWSDPLFQQASSLRREMDRFPTPFVLLHPDAARSHDLREGTIAAVTSPLGTNQLYVRCDAEIPQGLLVIPRRFAASASPVLGQAAHEVATGAWLYPALIARIGKAAV